MVNPVRSNPDKNWDVRAFERGTSNGVRKNQTHPLLFPSPIIRLTVEDPRTDLGSGRVMVFYEVGYYSS
jgi:hypothetical protein